MFPYSLEDSLQINLHSFYCGMVRIGKLFDSSLLTADAEIFPEYEVFIRCQDAVEQGIDLLCDFKTGCTVEGKVVGDYNAFRGQVCLVFFKKLLRLPVLPFN